MNEIEVFLPRQISDNARNQITDNIMQINHNNQISRQCSRAKDAMSPVSGSHKAPHVIIETGNFGREERK